MNTGWDTGVVERVDKEADEGGVGTGQRVGGVPRSSSYRKKTKLTLIRPAPPGPTSEPAMK